MAEAEQALSEDGETVAPEPRTAPTLTAIILSQLTALEAYHRAVLASDDVEAVHKMRVTTRRLQASIDLLGREADVRKLKRRLRNWRRALSRVRNYDVFQELIDKEATGRRHDHREQLELVKALLAERRVRKAEKIRQFLEGIQVQDISLKLGLSFPPAADGASGQAEQQAGPLDLKSEGDAKSNPARFDEKKIAGYAAERLEQRLTQFQAIVAQSQPTTDPAELHRLRIAAKRVRYLLENVQQMGFGDASRALAMLRTLQDRIGDWHDFEAIEEEIIQIISSRKFMKQHLAESGRMLQAAARLQKKKEALVAKLFPVKTPRTVVLTSERLIRALRRRAQQGKAPARTRPRRVRKPASPNQP